MDWLDTKRRLSWLEADWKIETIEADSPSRRMNSPSKTMMRTRSIHMAAVVVDSCCYYFVGRMDSIVST